MSALPTVVETFRKRTEDGEKVFLGFFLIAIPLRFVEVVTAYSPDVSFRNGCYLAKYRVHQEKATGRLDITPPWRCTNTASMSDSAEYEDQISLLPEGRRLVNEAVKQHHDRDRGDDSPPSTSGEAVMSGSPASPARTTVICPRCDQDLSHLGSVRFQIPLHPPLAGLRYNQEDLKAVQALHTRDDCDERLGGKRAS
jgi:hypothetical protein